MLAKKIHLTGTALPHILGIRKVRKFFTGSKKKKTEASPEFVDTVILLTSFPLNRKQKREKNAEKDVSPLA